MKKEKIRTRRVEDLGELGSVRHPFQVWLQVLVDEDLADREPMLDTRSP